MITGIHPKLKYLLELVDAYTDRYNRRTSEYCQLRTRDMVPLGINIFSWKLSLSRLRSYNSCVLSEVLGTHELRTKIEVYLHYK